MLQMTESTNARAPETILETATEEPLGLAQQDRYQKRVVNLAQLREDFELSEQLALEMADAGNYGGVALLARGRIFDPLTRGAGIEKWTREALAQLESHAPGIFGSPEATALIHRLWMSASLPHLAVKWGRTGSRRMPQETNGHDGGGSSKRASVLLKSNQTHTLTSALPGLSFGWTKSNKAVALLRRD